jgi:hypothetical protein
MEPDIEKHWVVRPRDDVSFRMVRYSPGRDTALFEIANRYGRTLSTANRFTFLPLPELDDFIVAVDREIMNGVEQFELSEAAKGLLAR